MAGSPTLGILGHGSSSKKGVGVNGAFRARKKEDSFWWGDSVLCPIDGMILVERKGECLVL